MTAQEKAKELINKFHEEIYPKKDTLFQAKQCALIAVDEILNIDDESYYNYDIKYYQQVKEEIEKL